MKRIRAAAFLFIICCIVSIASLPASAEQNIREIDRYLCCGGDGMAAFLVETDGVHPMETLLTDFCEISSIQQCNTAGLGIIICTQPITDHTYLLHTEIRDEASLLAMGRRIATETDWLENVTLSTVVGYGKSSLMYEFILYPNDETSELSDYPIPELDEFELTSQSTVYRYWTYTLTDPETSVFKAQMDAANLTSEYEQYQYMREYADAIQEHHSDVLEQVDVSVFTDDMTSYTEISAASIWNTAGDLDADGEIDASDAAELLSLSAMKGATADGAADPFTAEQKSAADLNGDTFCDANDAAYILQFAAEAGAGSELSIGEFMTRD